MNIKQITPAALAIRMFGGVNALARDLDLDPAAVSRWQKNGTIPSYIQRKLLEIAWDKDIDITAEEIIFGKLDE